MRTSEQLCCASMRTRDRHLRAHERTALLRPRERGTQARARTKKAWFMVFSPLRNGRGAPAPHLHRTHFMRSSRSSWNELRSIGGHARLCAGVAAAWVALGEAAPARACPKCAEGVAARAEVWGMDFGFHLFAMLLPLCVIAMIAFAFEKLASGRQPAHVPALDAPHSGDSAGSERQAAHREEPT